MPANTATAPDSGASLATIVMAHPWRILLPASLFLILLGMPFLHIQLGSTDVTGLPKTAESRRGWEQLHSEFQKFDTNPIIVVVHYPDSSPLTAEHIDRIYELSRWLAKLPAVNRVESIVDLGPAISRGEYVQTPQSTNGSAPTGRATCSEKDGWQGYRYPRRSNDLCPRAVMRRSASSGRSASPILRWTANSWLPGKARFTSIL